MGLVKSVNIYECDVCGKKEKWSTKWRSKTIHHKTWDEHITVCSTKCAIAYDKK